MDIISRVYCETLKLRAYTVTSLEVVREITALHKTTPNATVALGRTINAAALLAATLKPQSSQSLLLKFSGSGPIGEIHVQADAHGHIRGYAANPMVDLTDELDKISFSKTIGAGLMTVIKDTGMKEPYSSVTPLLRGEVAADLAYYLATSEQVPSAVIIGLNINHEGVITSSGGILIQTFPDTDIHTIELIESNIAGIKVNLGDRLQQGQNIYSVVEEIFSNNKTEILSTTPLKHKCRCSHETLLGLIKTFDKNEIKDMIDKDNGASITCTFCTKEYFFNKDELEKLIR
jgi:molecular chaperone Hsp33